MPGPSGDPSPKRRRTATAAYQTNEGVVQTNATMHAFLGSPRQNRCMVGAATPDSATATPGKNRTGQWDLDEALRKERDAALGHVGDSEQALPTPDLLPSNASNGEGAIVVAYDAPAGADARQGRKSLDARAAPAGSLPSPAPSEDNVNSPILRNGSVSTASHTHSHMSERQSLDPNRRRSVSGGTPSMLQSRRRLAHQPMHMAGQHYAAPAPAQRIQYGAMHPAQAVVPSPLQQQQTFLTPSLYLGTQRSPLYTPTAGHGPQWPVQNGKLVGQAQQQAQSRSTPPRGLFDMFDQTLLLQQIDAQRHALQSRPDAHALRSDLGRVELLNQAVRRGDSFHLVLSQLFCVKTIQPQSLAPLVASLPDASWEQLGSLLCPNAMLALPTVAWLADFPAPFINLHSGFGPLTDAYKAQVAAVVDFLHKLPHQWPMLCHTSKQRQSPPLIQDLVESLGLHSPALQLTAIRAIARMIYAQSAMPGLDKWLWTIEGIFEADLRLYARGGRRDEIQKNYAHEKLQQLFTEWKRHEHRVQMQDVPGVASAPSLPFQIQNDVLLAFGIGNLAQANAVGWQAPANPLTPPQLQVNALQNTNAPPQQRPTAPVQHQLGNATAMAGGSETANPTTRRGTFFPSEQQCPRPQPTHPDTARSALHLAYLRSPILTAAPVADGRPTLYRYVEACALSPTRIDGDQPIQIIAFTLSNSVLGRIPDLAPGPPGAPKSQSLSEASKTYRLRCCKIDMETGFPTLSSWIEADITWPDNVYFDLNGKSLDVRKKLHHGRCLPIEITKFVRPGRNDLKIIVNRPDSDKTPFHFAVAIEMVAAVRHENIRQHIQILSAEESLATLKRSLAPQSSPDDDDLVMVSNVTNINLFDPIIGSKIFDTPVRGKTCLHRDPFDLEVFLGQIKRPAEDAPSVVDAWRCPICRKDVRPDNLILDGFLANVREELARKGLLETRAIVVRDDGSWKPKAAEKTGVRSASLEREEGEVGAAKTAKVAKPMPVVIELD